MRQAGAMNSRNRLISLVAVVLLGIAAGVAALLNGGSGPDGASSAKSPSAASAPGTAPAPGTASASRGGAASAPKPSAPAKSPTARGAWAPTDPALADVCRRKLPAQALDTLGLIARGGPYPYRSDG